MTRPALIAACVFATLAYLPATAKAITYRIDDICALTQPNGRLMDINNLGQIVGYVETSSNVFSSFVWQNGQLQNIGTLGGQSTWGKAINDRGQVTGYSTRAGSMPEVAMIWQNGQIQSIGNLGGANSFGADINENCVVAGYSQLCDNGSGHAYTWSDGVTSDSGRTSQATGINDLNEVAMLSNSRGYIWRNGTITDLGSLGGGSTYPTRINNNSQVVGSSYLIDNESHAFVWNAGTITDLGAAGLSLSSAHDINDGGLIVGCYGWDYATNANRACMWQDGVMTDLNTFLPADSGWTLFYADAVNDLGQIVGKGMYNGEYRGYLLTPTPEPSAGVVLVSGLALLCGCRRRRLRR